MSEIQVKPEPPPGPKPPGDIVYRLKGMALVRLLAEATALVILVVLPIILLIHGDFWRITLITRVIVCLVSVVSLAVLPFYFAITHKVKLTAAGISTHSLIGSHSSGWHGVRSLKLKTSWGLRRYIVTTDQGDLTFPVWFNDLGGLVGTIRSRLPNRGFGGPLTGGARVFTQDTVSFVVQSIKTVCALGFIGIFWMFAFSLQHQKHVAKGVSDPNDFWFVVAVCLVATVLLLVRTFFIVTMPKRVEVRPDGLLIQSMFFQRNLPWDAIRSMGAAWVILPTGVLLQTKSGPVLIGDQLDAFDELQEELNGRFAAGARK